MGTTKNTRTSLKAAGVGGGRGGGRRTTITSTKQANALSVKDHTCSKVVSHKLRALKSLIPPFNRHIRSTDDENDDQIVKADQLYQKTADYIILLRAQVVLLQKLVQLYGSTSDREDKQNAVLY